MSSNIRFLHRVKIANTKNGVMKIKSKAGVLIKGAAAMTLFSLINKLLGVFLRLFDSGVSAVCNLVNLDKLPADKEFLLTMSFLPYPGAVTQIPASVIAEI